MFVPLWDFEACQTATIKADVYTDRAGTEEESLSLHVNSQCLF